MIKTIWKCDGCDKELDMTAAQHRHDWKIIKLSVDGFDGYPTCGIGNIENGRFELYPSCASRLADQMNPLSWAREQQSIGASE